MFELLTNILNFVLTLDQKCIDHNSNDHHIDDKNLDKINEKFGGEIAIFNANRSILMVQ